MSTQPSNQGAVFFFTNLNSFLWVVSGEKMSIVFGIPKQQKIIVKIFAYFLTKNLHQKQRKITAKKLACFSYKKFNVFEALSKLFWGNWHNFVVKNVRSVLKNNFRKKTTKSEKIFGVEM